MGEIWLLLAIPGSAALAAIITVLLVRFWPAPGGEQDSASRRTS